MIRLLFINPAAQRGGAETVLLDILTHLDRKQFEPRVLSLQAGDFNAELREKAGVEAAIVLAPQFRDFFGGRNVIKQIDNNIRDNKIDLVHCNGTGAHLYGSPAARRGGVPSVFHVHDSLNLSFSRQGLLHWFARRTPATEILAVSRSVARPFPKAHVIHNAVNLAQFDPLIADSPSIRKTVRAEFGWSPDAPLVVWCGRLQHWKGAHIFLEAAARVAKDLPAARFLVVGGTMFGIEQHYEQKLKRQATSLNLTDCLQFTGHRADAKRFLAAADAVAHTSIRPEPFGLVVLEGMALGRAVIASNTGGPSEIIVNEVSGLLVQPNNPNALAASLLRLLHDPSLRTTMGLTARSRVATEFEMTGMMEKIQTLYLTMVTNSRTVPAATPCRDKS